MTTGNEERFSVISDGLPSQLPDVDPDETSEWLDSLDAVHTERPVAAVGERGVVRRHPIPDIGVRRQFAEQHEVAPVDRRVARRPNDEVRALVGDLGPAALEQGEIGAEGK